MSGSEVEIKLILPPAAARRLEACPAIATARASRRQRRLLSTYFDTPDDRLSRQGFHLRVRETGGSWIQTVKSTRAGLARGEWERAIGSPFPVAEMGGGSPADAILARRKVLESLAPAFTVDVQRTTWDLKLPRADVEVALDRGSIVAGNAREDICEVELELKDGDAGVLFDVARSLRASAPVRLTLLSKGRRGFRLRSGSSGAPEKPSIPPLEPEGPAALGARAILTACVASLLLNLSLLAARPEPDLVHQTRVALRRVRAALTLFGPVLGAGDSDALSVRLGELSRRLGTARDLDVFLESGSDSISEGVRAAVRANAATRRERAYADLAAELDSDGHFEVTLAALKLAETGGDVERGKALKRFLARRLDRRHRGLLKASRRLHKLDEHDRHRVRIRAKKLRYMIEFVEGISPGKPFRRLRDTLEILQESLGTLNDTVVARAFAEEALAAAGVADPASQVASPAHVHKRGRELMDEARAARRRLARLKPFWRRWKT